MKFILQSSIIISLCGIHFVSYAKLCLFICTWINEILNIWNEPYFIFGPTCKHMFIFIWKFHQYAKHLQIGDMCTICPTCKICNKCPTCLIHICNTCPTCTNIATCPTSPICTICPTCPISIVMCAMCAIDIFWSLYLIPNI